MSSSKRHFTAVVGSKEHGLYISASPSSAARKIVSKLCASSKSKKVEFCVREITQGSKKKTYGPYLGEMKKLVKPIELKGRVIRFDIKVHLKKKKTATKTAKKIGKKMRGGTIEKDGILLKSDFIFDIGNIDDFKHERVQNSGYMWTTFYLIPKEQYNSQPECRTKTYNKNHYIFFSKKINDFEEKNNKIMMTSPQIVYEYVVFLDKDDNIQFKKSNMEDTNMEDIDISKIRTFELKKLKTFLDKTRMSNKSFCAEIYKAVTEELSKKNRPVNYIEMMEIEI
jgi:hypothetical protein